MHPTFDMPFSRANTTIVMNNTASGSVGINDVLLQVQAEGLPFGGVGPSGYGTSSPLSLDDNANNYIPKARIRVNSALTRSRICGPTSTHPVRSLYHHLYLGLIP